MIDFTKPVRWVDDKRPAEVLKANANGSAWVIEGNGNRAFLYDRSGTWEGIAVVENIPEPGEPRVTWVWQFADGSADPFRSESKAREYQAHTPFKPVLLKLTYVPGHASVEIIEERK